MVISHISAIVLRQFYLLRSSPARALPLFLWVALDMVLWGFITRYLNSFGLGGLNFIPLLLGCVLLWDFFIRVMQGVTIAFFEDVWSRNFLNIFATPMTIPEYLSGLVLSSICTSALGLAVMLVLATMIFGLSFLSYGALLIPFLMVLFVFGAGLGVLACGLVLRFGPAAEWLIWPIPAVLSPFAGVFYPVSTLPAWMQAVSRVLPPAYVFEGMRAIVAGKSVPAGTLAIAAALAVLDVALGCWYFLHIHRHALRTGLIARYSAESIT